MFKYDDNDDDVLELFEDAEIRRLFIWRPCWNDDGSDWRSLRKNKSYSFILFFETLTKIKNFETPKYFETPKFLQDAKIST